MKQRVYIKYYHRKRVKGNYTQIEIRKRDIIHIKIGDIIYPKSNYITSQEIESYYIFIRKNFNEINEIKFIEHKNPFGNPRGLWFIKLKNGEIHSLDGPASKTSGEVYAIDGVSLDKETWKMKSRIIKLRGLLESINNNSSSK